MSIDTKTLLLSSLAIFLFILVIQVGMQRSRTVLITATSIPPNATYETHIHDHQNDLPRRPKEATELDDDRDEKRAFRPYGSAAALFVVFGAYRGGQNTFAVVGLGSKPLYTFGNPEFECEWVPSPTASKKATIKSGVSHKMLPDMNYGRVYTVVVVNCTFEEPVGTDRKGGQLLLHASHGDGLGKPVERIVALTEHEGTYNATLYEPPYPYDFLYCGSPLYGPLSASRIREWIAYHVRLFGPRSHFVFHDAGGMNAQVRAVLESWRKLGYITVQNVKQQAEFDGYYYNQFLIVNDCLHRTRFQANWTFFFDVDEYIYIDQGESFQSAMGRFWNDTAVQLSQFRMSDGLCRENETLADSTRWGFEKLVYRDMDQTQDNVKKTPKYAVQARKVYATGVHYSQQELNHMEGNTRWVWWPEMRYYHYHATITKPGELCSQLSSATSLTVDDVPFELDTSMTYLGPLVKQFELQHIGPIVSPS